MARSLIEYIIRVRSEDDLDTLIPELESWNIVVAHRYRRVFICISVFMTGLLVKWYTNDSRILSIEKSTEINHFAKQFNAPPHLDRLDQREQPLSGSYTFSLDGTDVIAYVLDSGGTFRGNNDFGELRGVDLDEFSGRLAPVPDPSDSSKAFDPFYDSGPNQLDENVRRNNPRGFDGLGHGTHVAGIVGSATFGTAKDVSIRTSKVFKFDGRTSSSIIIAGIDAILDDHINLGSPLAVCNMSFGGSVSVGAPVTSLETAVLSLISNGIVCVVAAGNSGINVEKVSPARMPEVITVGAIDRADNMPNFSNFQNPEDIVAPDEVGFTTEDTSNFGSLLDIFAVGVSVESTWKTPNANGDFINTLTGTSMSSPAAAGVVAMFIENSPGSDPATIKTDLLAAGTDSVITLTPDAITVGTPNKLLYSNFVDITVDWITPAGSLGSFNEGTTQNIELEAITFSGKTVIYQVFSGTLPTGLVLEANTGILSGVINTGFTSDTIFNFTIRAFDGNASPIFSDQNFSITILNQEIPPTWITSPDLGEVEESSNVNIQFTAASNNGIGAGSLIFTSIGTLPHGWVISTGGLLTGLAPQLVNDDLITGFTLNVTDGIASAPETFTITITQRRDFLPPSEPEWITPIGNIGTAIENQFFSTFVQAVDADGVPLGVTYHLQITADGSQFGPFGELPIGLSLNSNTGEISGTPNINFDQDFAFAIFATDGANIVGRLFEITGINVPENQPPEWITDGGNIGTVDSLAIGVFPLIATDPDSGPNPLTYTLVSGQLPPGMNLGFSTGIVSGVPQLVQEDTNFAFTVGVSDGIDQVNRTFSIIVNHVNIGPVWQTPAGQLASLNEGQNLTFVLVATDINGDELTYTLVAGELPPIMTLSSIGVISGAAESVNVDTVFNFTVQVDDSLGNEPGEEITVNRDFSIEILDGALNLNQGPEWVTPEGPLVQGTEGEPYFAQLEAIDPDGGPSSIQFFVSAGNFPAGLTLNLTSGIISGSPHLDDNIVDDVFNFTVRAFDGLDFSLCDFSIEIIDLGDQNIAPIWLTPEGSLGSFNEASPLIIALSAKDADDDPITFSLTSGGLPPGLILDETFGIISGTPAQVISDTESFFTITVTDSGGKFASCDFSLTILQVDNDPPVWSTPAGSIVISDEGTFVSFQLVAIDPDTSPNPTLTYNLTDQILPPGLTVSTTGLISGTLDDVLSDTIFTFEITVDDGLAFVPREFSITTLNAPVFGGTTSDLNVPLLGYLRNEWRLWNTSALIPDADLYLPTNPDFGRVTEPRAFVASNFHTDDRDVIFQAFGVHHERFSTIFGAPTLAVVRDEFGTIIYEVIYLKIIDPQKGSDFDITNIPVPSALDTNGAETYVSKSFFHLREEIIANLTNTDTLPDWMLSEQIDGDPASVLGYVPAIEMAFVNPGVGLNLLEILNEITVTTIILPVQETIFDGETTIFDGSTTTFDKVAKTITQINKAVGHQFTGREFIVDRYVYTTSLSAEGYIKFNSDIPNPIWITVPGSFGTFPVSVLISPIQLVAENTVGFSLIYSVIFGSLPTGIILNSGTGEITGTPTEIIVAPLVIRVTDDLGNFSDQVFEISII